MTVDRNTIVTLHKKKVRVILASQKSCIFALKLLGRWLKEFKETGETCNRPGQGRKRTVRRKRLVKIMREKLRRNSCRSVEKWLQKQESVKLQCVESSKMTSEPILTKYRKGMNFQRLMNIWDLTDVNTFWISWKMEQWIIWCSLMRRNLTHNNAKTTKNYRIWSRDGSVEGRRVTDARIHFLWWCGRQSLPLGNLHSFVYPQEWNWTASVTFRTFWKLNAFLGM